MWKLTIIVKIIDFIWNVTISHGYEKFGPEVIKMTRAKKMQLVVFMLWFKLITHFWTHLWKWVFEYVIWLYNHIEKFMSNFPNIKENHKKVIWSHKHKYIQNCWIRCLYTLVRVYYTLWMISVNMTFESYSMIWHSHWHNQCWIILILSIFHKNRFS